MAFWKLLVAGFFIGAAFAVLGAFEFVRIIIIINLEGPGLLDAEHYARGSVLVSHWSRIQQGSLMAMLTGVLICVVVLGFCLLGEQIERSADRGK